jgi:hypothetical protein
MTESLVAAVTDWPSAGAGDSEQPARIDRKAVMPIKSAGKRLIIIDFIPVSVNAGPALAATLRRESANVF